MTQYSCSKKSMPWRSLGGEKRIDFAGGLGAGGNGTGGPRWGREGLRERVRGAMTGTGGGIWRAMWKFSAMETFWTYGVALARIPSNGG